MGIEFKTNKVKCDIGSYIHYWRGVKKSGKTTLFYDLVKEQYKDLSKGLLIAVGDEIGYQALDGLVYVETPTWSDFTEVVDALVEENDNDFAVIGLDTVDELVKLAQEEVKRIHRKTKGQPAEFNACLGGFGQPRKKVEELIDAQLARLRRGGYGIIYIGHTKIRDVQEKNGDSYQQLTSNLSADYDGIFANKADIVMTIVVEKDIDDNKHINGTERYMYFRSDGFVDAGGRFSEMPGKVKYGAANYISAFEAGVKGAITDKVSEKDIEKRKKDEIAARAKAAAEYSKAEKDNKADKEANKEIIAEIQDKISGFDKKQMTEIKKLMKELNIEDFKNPSETPTKDLQKILEFVNSFNEDE